jgi:hypothetical protein
MTTHAKKPVPSRIAPGSPGSPESGKIRAPFKLGQVAPVLGVALLGVFILGSLLSGGTPTPERALARAIEAGDLTAVRAAIADGADVDHENGFGSTPMHSAAWHGDVAIARLLLDYGAKADVADTLSGETPLHSAARGDRPDMIRLLLEAGADSGARTRAELKQCDGVRYRSGVSASDIARQRGFAESLNALDER